MSAEVDFVRAQLAVNAKKRRKRMCPECRTNPPKPLDPEMMTAAVTHEQLSAATIAVGVRLSDDGERHTVDTWARILLAVEATLSLRPRPYTIVTDEPPRTLAANVVDLCARRAARAGALPATRPR